MDLPHDALSWSVVCDVHAHLLFEAGMIPAIAVVILQGPELQCLLKVKEDLC